MRAMDGWMLKGRSRVKRCSAPYQCVTRGSCSTRSLAPLRTQCFLETFGLVLVLTLAAKGDEAFAELVHPPSLLIRAAADSRCGTRFSSACDACGGGGVGKGRGRPAHYGGLPLVGVWC